MSQITIGGTTLNFKDSAFTGDQWEQVASWVLNGGAEGIDANAQIATEKAAAASASAATARNSATSAGESASAAAKSATAAKASEDAATGSATNAAASATSAGNSAAAASERADNAANSASVASSKANDAITAASDAQAAKNNAADSQTAAKQSEDNAAASATSAANSAASASSSATAAANSAASASESIKHAPRINADGKWELWDATTNAYVATEYTAIGKDGTKWWTYAYPIGITDALEKIMSKSNLPDADIGDYVLHTMSNAGIVFEITGETADGSSWVVKEKCTLRGKDGTTPHIGANGNWYIGDTDTGVSAGGSGLPAVTAADAGKFLRVSSSGSWVAETVANANGGEF